MDEEGNDVPQLSVGIVGVEWEDGDALESVVGKGDESVVQHEHVFLFDTRVAHDAKVFDELVVVFRAVFSGQHVRYELALRIERIQDLLCILSISGREQHQVEEFRSLRQEFSEVGSFVEHWLSESRLPACCLFRERIQCE